MKTYRSKLGPGLIIPLAIVLGGITILSVLEKTWTELILILAVDFFIIHMFATTYYQINDTDLKIRCGFLYNKTLPIQSIRKISKTNTALSAPAASFDRLEISYNTSDSVIISPKDKTGFIKELTALNPSMEVEIGEDI